MAQADVDDAGSDAVKLTIEEKKELSELRRGNGGSGTIYDEWAQVVAGAAVDGPHSTTER